VDAFLNEASVEADISLDAAQDRVRQFVRVLREVRAETRALSITSEIPISAIRFSHDISFAQLRNSGLETESLFIKSLANRAPFRSGAEEIGAPDPAEFEFSYADAASSTRREVIGLGLAFNHDTVAFSFDDPFWRRPSVDLVRTHIEDDELTSSNVVARNICTDDDVNCHRRFLSGWATAQRESGIALWQDRKVLFPHLTFIPRVEAQLCALKAGDPHFFAVRQRLQQIETAMANWNPKIDAAPVFGTKMRPESDSRVKEGLVDFRDEKGVMRTFSLHCDYTPGANRIHLITSAEPKFALIGHIGRKLGIG